MVAGRGIIVKVVERLFREVGEGTAKGATKDLSKNVAGDLAKNTARDSRKLADRVLTKDPIDVVTGEVTLRQTDVELAGVLPLIVERTHLSSYGRGRLFGVTWASTLDQRLEIDSQGVSFIAADGMVLYYPHPVTTEPVLAVAGPRWPLARFSDGDYTVTDPQTGRVLRFRSAFGGAPLLVTMTDRNDNQIEIVRDTDGTPTQLRHSGGYRIAVDSHDGRVTALRLLTQDGYQSIVGFGYDEAGNLAEVVNSSGRPLRFEYDTEARLTGWADRNGFWYRYQYDEQGRGVRGFGSEGFLDASLSYDDYGYKTTVTDSLGHATTYHFNEACQVIAETDPLGRTSYRDWDASHRLLAHTDPLNRTTHHDYDLVGNVTSTVLPGGRRLIAEYNDLHLPIRLVEADGAVWRREYDERGNLIALTDPLGATTRWSYTEKGGLTKVTDALGAITRIETDAVGRPLTLTDPLGGASRYTYDAFGRPVTMTDPVGGVTRYVWTVEGRLSSATLPSGATERWTYDGEGNPVSHLDALGRVVRTEYGQFDVPTARTEADGARLEFGYDKELRLISVTNPQGLAWRYDYDAAGRLRREVDFNGRVLLYGHDAAGRLVERVNGAGETVHYLREMSGNVVREHGPGHEVSFSYDLAGRLVQAANADADVRFERDARGRVVAETCNGRRLSATMDPLGRRVRRRTPTGAVSVWDYDAAGRPATLRTAGRQLTFGYDAAGREVRRGLGGGATLLQEWDANHLLSAQSVRRMAGEVVQQRDYSYAADGNLAGITDRLTGSRRFELDMAGRVTAVNAAGWTERYAYDAAGNLTRASWPADDDAGGDREYAGTLIRRAGRTSYRHDAQGRLVHRRQVTLSGQRRDWRYEWDADDRLVAVTTPAGRQWRYRYDPFGRRIAKQRLAKDGSKVVEQVEFTWDGLVLVEERHTGEAGTVPAVTVWEYEPGTFRPVSQTGRSLLRDAPQEWIDDRFHSIVTDLVGTPADLVDSRGDPSWHSHTTLWGEPLGSDQGTAQCPLRFPGQYKDSETGSFFNYHRYYDPATARYGSQDRLGLAPAPNPQAYVRNPLSWSDPLGLAPYRNGVISSSQEVSENLTSIAKSEEGWGFTGVHDPATGSFEARLSSGPNALVRRIGGHGVINAEVFGDSETTVAFVAILQDGGIGLRWNSISVNVNNWGVRATPLQYRQGVIDALKKATGLPVSG